MKILFRPLFQRFLLPSLLCAVALGPDAAAQDRRPRPIPPQHADVETSWPSAQKTPLSPERIDETASAESAQAELNGELPPALRGIIAPHPGEELHFDRPGTGALWVRGNTFKARFNQDGATYVPFFGSEAPQNFPITFRAPELAIDGVPVSDTAAPVAAQRIGDSVEYSRPALVERYDLKSESMEQLFVFESRLREGAASVFVEVETELEVRPTPSGDLRFENEYGHVDYSRAIVFDADGDRLELATTWTGTGIEIQVPAEFLASADYPVIVDPVLTTFTLDNSDNVTFNPDVAYDATHARYLIVWESVFSASDHDVWGEVRLATGGYIASNYIDSTDDNWAGPRVANNNHEDGFLVVAAEGIPGSRIISGRRWHADTNSMSSQYRINHGDTGESFNVDIGGDRFPGADTTYCVVWQNEHTLGADHSIHARLLSSTGNPLGPIIPIDNTNGTVDALPRISNSSGEGFTNDVWGIVWMRQNVPGNWNIRGAQVRWDGHVVTPSFPIDSSQFNEELPVASSTLDGDGQGEKLWMVSYVRKNSGPGEIYCTLLRGDDYVDRGKLADLEGVNPTQRRKYPDLDSDGRSFFLIYSERFQSSSTNYDIYASTLFWNGASLICPEAHQLMGGSTGEEYEPALCAAYSGGGARYEAVGVWTDYSYDFDDYDVKGGTYLGVPPPLGDSICTSTVNSSNQASRILLSGSPFVSDRDITLTSTNNPAGVVGLFFFGTASIQVPFGDGYRCVGGFIERMYRIATTDGAGTAEREVDWSKAYAGSIAPGPLYFQYWFRDTAAGQSGFNLSDAFHAQLLP